MQKNFGEDLKKIREGKKITLQEVALKTRFGIHIFEKMESGDFSFEIPTYIRAYLKQYAIAIDENPDVVLKDFDLAKAGKYQTKVFEEVKTQEVPKETPQSEEKQESKQEPKQELKVEIPKKEEEVKEPVKEEKPEIKEEVKPAELKKSEPVKHRATNDDKSKPIAQQNQNKDYSINIIPKTETRESSFKVDSSVMKTMMIILFVLLAGTGLYFLVTSLFIGKNDVEIVRQNFDEIVQENEKNILGKKTPAEIADSIRKAEEEAKLLAASQGDSLSLTIKGVLNGEIIIIPDSVGIESQEIISFGQNDSATWKASRYFLITTSNSGAFDAILNGKRLVFDRKRFKNLVINKDGIVPQTGGTTTTRTRTTQRNESTERNQTPQTNTNETTQP